MSRTDLKFGTLGRRVAAATLLLLYVGAMVALTWYLTRGTQEPPVVTTRIMLCPEDAVIVGRGEYTGGVGWDTYECVALDDLTTRRSK